MPFSCCLGGSASTQRAQRALSPSSSSESDHAEAAGSSPSVVQQESASLSSELVDAYLNQRVTFGSPSSSNSTKRLVGEMTVGEAVTTIADHNPGAFRVLTKLLTQSRNSKTLLNKMDDAGIYGGRIWDLYKDVCGEDYTKTFRLLLNLVNNRISADELKEYIDNRRQWTGD